MTDAGLESYLAIFHNRGKTSDRYYICGKWGKGSNSVSRRKRTLPDGCATVRYNNAVKTFHIVDTYPEAHSNGIKGQSVCLKYTGTNQQIHTPNSSQSSPRWLKSLAKPTEIRFIDLPMIHHNLWIGDLNCIQFWMEKMQKQADKVIINLSDVPISCDDARGRSQATCYSIPFLDTRTAYFKDLYPIFLKVKDLLDTHLSRPVLLVCQAGVNRSSTVAVAYAISKGFKCNETIEYLADRKYEVSPNWDNITNIRFRTILRQLQSRRGMGMGIGHSETNTGANTL